jgi:hypothetical protein
MSIQYTISVPSLEENPIQKLSDCFTVGSQEGDLILTDPSVESKHCTFFVNDDVVSIMDHNTGLGTYIDDERIPANKMIILLPGDQIKFGDVSAELIGNEGGEGTNVLLYSMGSGGVSDAKSVEQLIVDQIINEVGTSVEDADLLDKANEQTRPAGGAELGDEDKTQDNIQIPAEMKIDRNAIDEEDDDATGDIDVSVMSSANRTQDAIYRTLCVLIEVFLAYALYNIAFSEFLEPLIFDLVIQNQPLFESIPVIGSSASLLTVLFGISIIYALIRIISAAALGLSWTQKVVGMQSDSESKGKDITREVIGVLTGPLLVGELLLFKGESLKEKISKTNIFIDDSKKAAFYTPLLFAITFLIAILSPLFYQLQEPKAYLIQMSKAKKVKRDMVFANSINLKMKIAQSAFDKYDIYPIVSVRKEKFRYSFKGISKKDNKKTFLVEKQIKIIFPKLVRSFATMDPLFGINYPALNKALNNEKAKNILIQNELTELIKASMEIDLISGIQRVTQSGPFLSGYTHFKTDFLKEIGINNPSSLKLTRTKEFNYLSVSQAKGKKSKILIIPINFDISEIINISGNMKEANLSKVATDLFGYYRSIPETELVDLTIAPTNAFSTVDFLIKYSTSQDPVESSFLDYVRDLKQKSFIESDTHKKVFGQSLNGLIKYMNIVSKENPSEENAAIVNELMIINSDEY